MKKKLFFKEGMVRHEKGIREKGLLVKLMRVIEDLYKNNRIYIMRNIMKLEGFKTYMGLRIYSTSTWAIE